MGCFKKSFITLKVSINLFRGHVQCISVYNIIQYSKKLVSGKMASGGGILDVFSEYFAEHVWHPLATTFSWSHPYNYSLWGGGMWNTVCTEIFTDEDIKEISSFNAFISVIQNWIFSFQKSLIHSIYVSYYHNMFWPTWPSLVCFVVLVKLLQFHTLS
jgi:hypothetical protein